MRRLLRKALILTPFLIMGCAEAPPAKPDLGCVQAEPGDPVPNRPKVPGILQLTMRERGRSNEKNPTPHVFEKPAEWKVNETAVIICDMWDDHYCKSSAQRVAAMTPRMNQVLTAARSLGVQIIHSPSGTIPIYEDTPYRKRILEAKPATPPVPLKAWCHLDKSREPELPIDTSKCACDDPVVGSYVRRYTRQHAGIDIIGYDGISDNGQELYNFFVQEGIKNVAIMGVHTNMCVLGRPFGIRQLVQLGFNVALVRDLTDAMYDPRQPPYVSHTRGTEMVIEHIEQYWCPSILSNDLMQVMTEQPAKR